MTSFPKNPIFLSPHSLSTFRTPQPLHNVIWDISLLSVYYANYLKDIPVRTLATHPQNLPAASTVLAELAQPVITEYDSVPPEPEHDFRSMTDSQLADYLASFIFDTPSGADSGPDYVAPFNFNTFQPFDPAPAFNPLMPATPPPDHSSQTFPFTFMEPPAAPAPHFTSEFSLPLSHADDVQWPMLPPIRPRSPSGTDSADEIPAESTTTSNITKKGRPRQEVDPANILTSVRSRNPSRRKRCSEEESEPAKKRAKTSKVLARPLVLRHLLIRFISSPKLIQAGFRLNEGFPSRLLVIIIISTRTILKLSIIILS
jgi:hypothetical protein